jgi:pimeloyl-ACP methyl ester carboxylesterase
MMEQTVTESELQLALRALDANARFEVLRASRYEMRFFVWGAGPPIVFIHGMADHAKAFAMVMHHIAEQFTCIGYELPDGETDGSRLKTYKHSDYVDDLMELLDHLGFQRVAVLGSSFGSTIALAAMAKVPHRFTKGVLQGSFAYRPLTYAQRILSRTASFWPGWVADWPALYRCIMRRIERPSFSSLPPAVSQFLLETGGHTPLRAMALRSVAIDRLDLRPLLSTIQTPVLMISGDRDPLVPRQCEDAIEHRLSHVQRIEFSDCGHYPHYTHPALMAETIIKFLVG